MIALEGKEGKYDLSKHADRLERVIGSWDRICDIISEEIPEAKEIEALLRGIGAPVTPDCIGIDSEIMPTVLRATADIRDKYVLSRLAWDLGVQDELFGKI